MLWAQLISEHVSDINLRCSSPAKRVKQIIGEKEGRLRFGPTQLWGSLDRKIFGRTQKGAAIYKKKVTEAFNFCPVFTFFLVFTSCHFEHAIQVICLSINVFVIINIIIKFNILIINNNNAWTIYSTVFCISVTPQHCLHTVQWEVLMMGGRLFKFYRHHADPSAKHLFWLIVCHLLHQP